MKWIKQHWLALALLVLPFLVISYYWDTLPEKIPVHWNEKGEVDRYGDKVEVFLLPIISIFTYLFVMFLPRIDPKNNIARLVKVLDKIGLALAGFMTFIFLLTFSQVLGYTFNITNVILYAVIGLFMIIGNFMGKFRPNYFVGIRTPWTLENEEVWVKTHRFTGALWVSASAAMLFFLLFQYDSQAPFIYLFFAYVGVITIIPILYSFWIYQQIKKNEADQE